MQISETFDFFDDETSPEQDSDLLRTMKLETNQKT